MLVYFTISLIVLLGFCGLALDIGRMEVRTLQLQSAADVAALGAANEYARGTSNWGAAASYDVLNYLSANNLPSTVSAFTVTQGPASGPFTGDYSTIQVNIQQPLNTFFLGLLSSANRTYTVSATGTAQMPPCDYFFANPASNTWHTAGQGLDVASAGVNSPCPVYTKSNFLVDGFAHIYAPASASGPAPALAGGGYAPVIPNHVAFSDPIASVVAPTLGTCTFTAKVYVTAQPISPGTYCGTALLPGLTITATTITMNPGLYVITGGMSITSSTINGAGVTMYFTKGGAAGYGVPTMNSTTFNVSAPVTSLNGSIPQVVMMNDRNWVGNNEDFQFYYCNMSGDGIFYISGTGIYSWVSNWSAPNYVNLVTANMYHYDGNVNTSGNYSGLPGGSIMTPVITLVQ